jgi:hypothetical protein
MVELQLPSYPALKVPVVLPFLANSILALGGLETEGIFRVSGDNDCIFELKSRIDRGHHQLVSCLPSCCLIQNGIDDPHVAASLFKLRLRELEEPLVPTHLYNAALVATKSPADAIEFVTGLPVLHRRVLLSVISFAQLFLHPDVIFQTKMTLHNLCKFLAVNLRLIM